MKPLFTEIKKTKQPPENQSISQPSYYIEDQKTLYHINPSISFAHHCINSIQNSGGFIEQTHLSTDINGFSKFEVQASYPNGSRAYYVIKNLINTIDSRQVCINSFNDKKSRNAEIKRLYACEGLTQEFLGKIFNLHQTTISGIVNS